MSAATTRRRVLAGVAGGAIAAMTGGVGVSAASSLDAEFFALHAEHARADQEFKAATNRLTVAEEAYFLTLDLPLVVAGRRKPHDILALEAAQAAALDRESELFERLSIYPVHTLDGIRAKLSLLADALEADKEEIDAAFATTTLAAIDGLIAGGAS